MRSASEVAIRSFNEYIEEREMSSIGGEKKRKIMGRQKGGREKIHRSTEGKKGRDEN